MTSPPPHARRIALKMAALDHAAGVVCECTDPQPEGPAALCATCGRLVDPTPDDIWYALHDGWVS